MGRSYTPAYAVEYVMLTGGITPAGWNGTQEGRPTDAALARHVSMLEASARPGGCNAHCGDLTVRAARIVTNRGERVTVALYERTAGAAPARWTPDRLEPVTIAS